MRIEGLLCGSGIVLWAMACASGAGTDNPTAKPSVEEECPDDYGYRCEGDTAVTCDGERETIDCLEIGQRCMNGLGCVVCTPGEGGCGSDSATVCRPDGQGYETYHCDPVQGMSCQPDGCKGVCSWGSLGTSYVGCDYYPTVTVNNGVWQGFAFAATLSNLGETAANVVVTRGDDTIDERVVAPGELAVIELPWIRELKGPDPNFAGQPSDPGPTAIVKAGAYRVRSDQPLAAYQFSPLAYEMDPMPADCPEPVDGGCFSYSNDASLLLPAHTLRRRYPVMAWNNVGCRPGFIAVTATEDDTQVSLDLPGGMLAETFTPGAGIDTNGQGIALLDAGDVLQILGRTAGGGFCFQWDAGDVSGSVVKADKRVQVIAGNACANTPTSETQACDHLEESMFPTETLGSHYLVSYPAAPEADSPYTLRVSAVYDDTEVVFDPPIHDPIVLSPGDPPLEVRYVSDDVFIKGDGPILVAQYMHGTDANVDTSNTGDPALTLAVPSAQYRNEYTFLAPSNYDHSYVNVIAKVGESVTIDETVLAPEWFTPIGDSGWAALRHPLDKRGVHRAFGAEGFGIVVYGYGAWTSYMYPGGLKLGYIPPPLK